MEEYTLDKLKKLAQLLRSELEVIEETGQYPQLVAGEHLLTKDEFLLYRLYTLIEQIENTK